MAASEGLPLGLHKITRAGASWARVKMEGGKEAVDEALNLSNSLGLKEKSQTTEFSYSKGCGLGILSLRYIWECLPQTTEFFF